MKVLGLNITREKPTPKDNEDGTWKRLKTSVDKIFENTKTEREDMTRKLGHYNGEIWDEKELRADESKAKINLFFSTVQSIAPMLLDNRPIWTVIARKAENQVLANAYKRALNYAWDVLDMNMTTQEVVVDGMIMKVGLFKVFFDYAAGFGGEVCIESVDPREFFIAPGYSDPWKAPMCGIRTRKPLSYFRNRFPEAKDIEPDTEDEKAQMKRLNIEYGNSQDFELGNYFATLYEVFLEDNETEAEMIEDLGDKGEEKPKKSRKKKYPNGKFVYFTNKQYLGTEGSDFWHGKAPYVPYYNYKKPHDFLGTGEGDNIDGLCKEMNLQFQKLVGHARKYSDPNYTYDVNQIADDVKFKDTFHAGGQFYPVDRNQSNGAPAVEAILPNSLVPEVYQLLSIIPKFIEEETGATDVSKGIASKKQRQSASEIAILVESSYTRTRQRVRNLEWSLKRVCWLLINLMQQYYSEPRNYHTRENDEVVTDTISNSRAYAETLVASPKTVAKGQAGEKLNPEEQQEWEDYQKLIEAFGEKDPVYFDFDIEIETNSSLPLDKQSLANLAVRLYQMKAIDRTALLTTLQFPHGEEVAAKLDQMEQAQGQAQQPPQGGL